jgi:nitroreductase
MRAQTSQPVHEIIATRRSPRSLDPAATFTNDDLVALLEAARWAPSAFNGQPWRFFVGRNGDELFSAILSTLEPFNQSWAKNASVLITVAAKTTKDDGSIHADYQYDCGLAVSQLVFEAHNRGFVAHQMTGFNRTNSATILEMDSNLTPIVVVAIGKQDTPEKLTGPAAEREQAPRVRKPLSEIVIKGLPL